MTDQGFRTPVHVITGFLGSGKTTLLQALLADPGLSETAVIINEFGEVALDHLLVSQIEEGAVVLRNGCICCSIRTDLAETLRDLQVKRAAGAIPQFSQVVLETTGLADPLPVVATLVADPVLRHQFRLGSIVATIDAINGLDQLDRQPESEKQAGIADRLVLTKTDLVTDAGARARLDSLRERLDQINPSAPVMDSREVAGAAAMLLGGGVHDASTRADEVARWLRSQDGGHIHDVDQAHGSSVRSFCLRFPGPMDWTAFGVWLTMLLHRHGDKVLRVKGLLNVAGAEAPVVIHGVQQIVHPPVHLDAWPDDDRDTRIVFIMRDLDPRLIERSLRAFLGLRATASRAA